MRTEDLVGKGYFPAELPPPFNTEKLGSEAVSLFNHHQRSCRSSYKETQCIKFSIPKIGLTRRTLEIPNPIHQIKLSHIISENWNEILEIYNESDISASIPETDDSEKRAVQKPDFQKFKEQCIKCSFDKNYELKTDIAKYYPSIYTHSIAWAIHGKKEIKKPENRNNFSYFGNRLDATSRRCQSGQTNGIPIGPDTSRIISEILGCKFDKKLKEKYEEKFDNLDGYRMIDDCKFYFSSYTQAESAFKFLTEILMDYGLNINEVKTEIRKLPYPIESEWSILLRNFQIKNKPRRQRSDIIDFFSMAFKFARENPNDSVLKFASKVIWNKIQPHPEYNYTTIHEENCDLFKSLIFKMGISEPATLPVILKFLLFYSNLIETDDINHFIDAILENNIYNGHNFEVSWALWIAKTFSISIKNDIAQKILNSNDVISAIIALDMKEKNLISDSVDLSVLELELTKDGLINEWWLLTYESLKKGWLTPKTPELLENSEYFSELKNRGIEFYDSSKQVDIGEIEEIEYQFSTN